MNRLKNKVVLILACILALVSITTAFAQSLNPAEVVINRKMSGLVMDQNNITTTPASLTVNGVSAVADADLMSFTVTVAKIVDGDTIHITPAVFDSTKVRMINMDTPETYHKINNESDRLQKQYGDLATAGINDLISVGETVSITVNPDFPKDDYGRLLGQVYKEDKTNVNLKMVELGYAVSYFIWPIQNMNDYNMYQSAVFTAKQNRLGLWAETSEAFELPFVFRARNQGKGLLRYVGNSDTKLYYYPQNYALVPVDKRIFFKPEAQAIEQGYTKATDQPEPIEDDYQRVKIAEARQLDLGSKLIVTGVVSYIDGINYYIQDDTAAMIVRSKDLKANIGDKISAKGGTSEYYSLFQMVTEEVALIDSGNTINKYKITADQIGESLECQYVELNNLTVIGPDPDDQKDSRNKDKTYILEDQQGNRVFVRTKWQTPPELGKSYAAITGVITYSWNKYKLIPNNYVEAPAYVTIKFVTNNKTTLEDVVLQSGELLESPELESDWRYVFDKWYTDPEYTDAFDFSKPVTEDVILYARWLSVFKLSDYLYEEVDALVDRVFNETITKEAFIEELSSIIEQTKYTRLYYKKYRVNQVIGELENGRYSMWEGLAKLQRIID